MDGQVLPVCFVQVSWGAVRAVTDVFARRNDDQCSSTIRPETRKNQKMKITQGIEAATALVAFVCACSYLAVATMGQPPLKSWLDLAFNALTVIGTIGAAIVALYVSSLSQARVDAESRQRAALMAARLLSRVARIYEVVTEVTGALTASATRKEKALAIHNVLLPSIDASLLDFTVDELLDLTPLDGNSGLRLARCCEELRDLHEQCERVTSQCWRELSEPARDTYLDTWARALQQAEAMLAGIVNVLEVAADAAMPNDFESLAWD